MIWCLKSINKSDLLESICKHVHHVSFDKGVIFEPLFEKTLPEYFQQIIERNLIKENSKVAVLNRFLRFTTGIVFHSYNS